MKKCAKDIMSRDVVEVTDSTTVYDTVKAMVTNRISGVPVVDKYQNIIGVVTEKDLLVVLDFLGVHQAKGATVDECMSKDVISASEDTDIEEIARIFVQKNIKRVPILRDKKVLGIVSRHDILKDIL